jgi:hypothetical protein
MRAAQRFRMRPGKASFSLKTQALALDSPASRTNPPVRNFLVALYFDHPVAQSDRHGRRLGLPAILFLPATARIAGT